MPTTQNVRSESLPEDFRRLIAPPKVAWPTLLLFVMAVSAYVYGFWGGSQGWLPAPLAILLNALAVFWFFTVIHDASHNALSRHRWFNDLIGRIALLTFSFLPVYRAFRFIHMQHHRFANQPVNDPDKWCGSGPNWALPLRWATLDVNYYVWYVRRMGDRPRSEIIDTLATALFALLTLGILIDLGYGRQLLLFWFIPSRITITFLALAFDYWPHSPYLATQSENPYQASSNRLGLEWLLTPLLLSQNYHLVHHLYPLAPFYRYRRIWKAREGFHLAQRPLLVSPLGRRLMDVNRP